MKLLPLVGLCGVGGLLAVFTHARQPFAITEDSRSVEKEVPSQTKAESSEEGKERRPRPSPSVRDVPPESPLSEDGEVLEAESEPETPAAQWLMFTATWCPPCRAARNDFEAWMRRSGWVIDGTPAAHVRLVDADQQPDLVKQYRVASYPTFVLLQHGAEFGRFEGYPGREALVRRFHQAVETAPRAAAEQAVPIGTLKGQRDQIVRTIAALRPLLGTEGTLTVKLDRPGNPSLNLPLGDRISFRSGNPLVMRYTLKGDVLTCRFAEPYPRGRLTLGMTAEQPISAITLSATEVVFELPRAPDFRLRVEP